MPEHERGQRAAGFRMQLLARLRNAADEHGVSVARLHQRVAFERFLARLAGSQHWILKGGFALELRYGWGNRPTRDLDLRTLLTPHDAIDRLRRTLTASGRDDLFAFELGETAQELQGAPGGGLRVRVTARVAGVVFTRFSIDLASGDVLVGEPEELQGSDLLRFAGIAPVRFPIYPVAQHLAEKLHAYTLPRAVENTRVKDLVDMVTMIARERIAGDSLRASVEATFTARSTHPLPGVFAAPPASWAAPFRRLARETAIVPISDLGEGAALAARFWMPVLAGTTRGTSWHPAGSSWREGATT